MEEPGREEFIPSANMEITRDQTMKLCNHKVLRYKHIILTSNDDHIIMVFSIIVYMLRLYRMEYLHRVTSGFPVAWDVVDFISCQMLE